MAWSVSGNIKGPKGDQGNIGNTGPAGADGEGIAIAGSVATYANLPSLGPGDAGDGYLVDADGLLYIWSGTAFPSDGNGVAFQGPKGDTGTAATVSVDSTNTGAAGSNATVSNEGTTSAAAFKFTIPRGDKGNTGSAGAAATVSVDSTVTGAEGTNANVSNEGTSSAAAFKFTIPKGDTGAAGGPGQAGPAGDDGSVWFDGAGAPGSISGSKAGDYYLDTDNGDVYTLS